MVIVIIMAHILVISCAFPVRSCFYPRVSRFLLVLSPAPLGSPRAVLHFHIIIIDMRVKGLYIAIDVVPSQYGWKRPWVDVPNPNRTRADASYTSTLGVCPVADVTSMVHRPSLGSEYCLPGVANNILEAYVGL